MADQTPFQSWLDLCVRQSGDNSPNGGHQSSSQSQGGGTIDGISERLRQEARAHFASLSLSSSPPPTAPPPSPSNSSTTVTQDLSKAKSTTPNAALALLVSTLGPVFEQNTAAAITTNHDIDAKARALHCLMGALEGNKDLTHGVRQGVGRFLLELCRPCDMLGETDDDEPMQDYVDGANLTPEQITQQLEAMDKSQANKRRSKQGQSLHRHDDVRDAAVVCLTALLRSRVEMFPSTQKSQQSSSPVGEAVGVLHQSMELRTEVAMSGVRYRCQTDTSNHDKNWSSGSGYETTDAAFNVEDGLSELPRAKRSLCFDLLEGALDGVHEDALKWDKLRAQSKSDPSSRTLPSSLMRSLSTFASLTATCMHGETDPRCLLQILRLLNRIQQVILPVFFPSNGGQNEGIVAFPSVDIFDAVAPYYPIQFTPPKNDPHGITRAMLQDALLAVLCERGAIYHSQATMDKEEMLGERGEIDTMIILAGRLFLERLEPPNSSDYDPPSDGSDAEDKADAVRDLSALFLIQSPAIHNASPQLNSTKATPTFFTELSSTLARAHEDAVSKETKSLASSIRKLMASLAHTLEPTTSNGGSDITAPLWEAFVVDIIRRLSPALGSAPQGMHGRASTAYLASLAAEGGLMTLKTVLEGCYPRFLGVLSLLENEGNKDTDSKQKARDVEKMAAALRGIAALVSSCRVALQKWQANNSGVSMHPHPLSKFLPSTIQKVAAVLKEEEEDIGELKMAAVGALESLLTSADLSGLQEQDDLSLLNNSLSVISNVVLNDDDEVSGNSNNHHEWKTSCARVVGAALSLASYQEDQSDETVAVGCKRMNELTTSLLPKILASATATFQKSTHGAHYDLIVLAGACANGKPQLSQNVVSELTASIIVALQSSQSDPKAPAMALSYLVRRGGPNVGMAFHCPSSGYTPFDIINELCTPVKIGRSGDNIDEDGSTNTRQLPVGMSMLQLPVSREKDEEVASDTIKRAQAILPFFLPLYECPSAASSCGDLVQFVDQILPPLSEWDEVKLSVTFPLLSAVLTSSTKVWKTLEDTTSETLMSMIESLARFSINSDNDANSRSAASSCLFSVLLHSRHDEPAQLFRMLLREVVFLPLTDSIKCLGGDINDAASLLRAGETLSFISLLGSAAACKGGALSETADKISRFLVQLACTGVSQFPYTEESIQLTALSDEGQKHPLLDPAAHAYILPASAFGNMLSVQNGGAFWKQRMTHKILPLITSSLQAQAKTQNPPSLGSLAVVCHMLCCLPVSLLGESNIQQIIPTMVAGFVYYSKNLKALTKLDMIASKPSDMLAVILAALTKILAISPQEVSKFIGIIIPSLLLMCASAETTESYIPKQLLVFQCLEVIATQTQARKSVLREKDQVVAVLSAIMDHPSFIIRNAVVQVRNVWYTLA